MSEVDQEIVRALEQQLDLGSPIRASYGRNRGVLILGGAAIVAVLATGLFAAIHFTGGSSASKDVVLHGKVMFTQLTSANQTALWLKDCGAKGSDVTIADGSGKVLRVATGPMKTVSITARNADGTTQFAPQTAVCETDYTVTVPAESVYVISLPGLTETPTGPVTSIGTFTRTVNLDDLKNGQLPELTEDLTIL